MWQRTVSSSVTNARTRWLLDRTRRDHRQYIHAIRPEAGTLTLPGHPGDDMPVGTLNSILKKAGLK